MFRGLWRDLMHGGRALSRARGFTVVCVLSLGVGMAPVIAIPYLSQVLNVQPTGVDTEGLVEVLTTPVAGREATDTWSYLDFVDLSQGQTGATLVAWTYGESAVERDRLRVLFVSTNYFPTIHVPLFRGPGFSATTGPAVILGYRTWQTRFAADPAIIGRTFTLDDVPHVVAGIAPEGFDGHVSGNGGVDVYLPLERHPRFKTAGTDRREQWLLIHGRLTPGVSVAQASAAITALTSSLAKQYPSTNEYTSGVAAPYDPFGTLVRSRLTVIRLLGLTLTGMVLLVVCLNLSGMVQVRSAMRERELSIRQALGATRRQLMQYLLGESVVIAVLGGTLASLVLFSLPLLRSRFADTPLPPQIQAALGFTLPTIAFAVGLCLLTSVMFGLLPAVRFSRPAILSVLKDEAGVGGRRVGRVQRVAAALQVAIAVPLLVMSSIQLDRVRATASADLGFAAETLYAVPVALDSTRMASAGDRIRLVRDSLAAARGVAAATLADGLPLDYRGRGARIALEPDAGQAARFVHVSTTRVDADYLAAMGIPLWRGRGFMTADGTGAEPVTIISRTLADTLLPNADAGQLVGKRLVVGTDQQPQTLTIVGVSGDVPTAQMSTRREQLLLPLAQQPSQELFLIVRSAAGEPAQAMAAMLENARRDFDAENRGFGYGDGAAYPTVVTGAWLRQNSMDDFLRSSAVAGGAGAVILTLSALGIYGVVGLMVATRTRELAVRIALGASRRRVFALVIWDVVRLVAPGVVVGLIITAAFVRLNGDNLGIPLSHAEPLAYVVGAVIAVLVAVLASLAPARRAASVQPMVAMRAG